LPAPLLAGEAYASLLRGFADRDEGRHALDHFLRPFAQNDGRDALLAHLAEQRPDETALLPLASVRAPTVIVHGAGDPFVPVALGRRLQSAIPGATLEVIGDGAHFLPLDAPDRVATAVAGLLTR
jgi:pimeloyl-ACP methyl ester carboxylesterase